MHQSHQLPLSLSSYAELLQAHELLKQASGYDVAADITITAATCDSRHVEPGTLFVCKGAAFKRAYLLDAIESGACAYVSETDYHVGIPCLLVTDIRQAMARIADASFGHPSGKLKACAFTGTKGKTTSAYYLKGILDAQAVIDKLLPTPIFSSIMFDDGIASGPSKLTTPEPFDLQQHLANAVSSKARYAVMEASSQALKYHRVLGVEFAVGAFNNIGEDHISPIEHPTLQDYFESKLMLFSYCKAAVVNLDLDPQRLGRVLEAAQQCETVLTYSTSNPNADVFLASHERSDAGIAVSIRTPRFVCKTIIPTPVMFNVSNALGAVACAEALGISQEAICRGLETVRVPGRMEIYPSQDNRIIGVVDYAHNGMSLEVLLKDLRENYPSREICVVFGATGGKGVDRRETMGAAAGALADRIVITEDDPGPENPADICKAIACAVEAQDMHNWRIVENREEAVRAAVRETTRPAVVVVAGKGHETRMLRKTGAIPCEADGPMLKRILEEGRL